ncbi:MAG TPA: hypothetical protein VF678_15275 [bacterium]
MAHEGCPYQKLDAQQLDELLRTTVWSLNEIGLRRLVMNFLGAMTEAGSTGCALDHALCHQPTDPIITEVLHLQRHAMAKRVELGSSPHRHAMAN